MARSKSTPRQNPRFRPNGWRYMPRYMISHWDELNYAPRLTKEQKRIAPRTISPNRFVSKHVFDVEVVSQETRDEWMARARARREAAKAKEEEEEEDPAPSADEDDEESSSSSFSDENYSWPSGAVDSVEEHLSRKRARLEANQKEEEYAPAEDDDDKSTTTEGESSSDGILEVGLMAKPEDTPVAPAKDESEESSDGILEVGSVAKPDGDGDGDDDDEEDLKPAATNEDESSSDGILEVW
eukprot:scaffold5787_cov157-Amphora_coffeaeformis.AAC.5